MQQRDLRGKAYIAYDIYYFFCSEARFRRVVIISAKSLRFLNRLFVFSSRYEKYLPAVIVLSRELYTLPISGLCRNSIASLVICYNWKYQQRMKIKMLMQELYKVSIENSSVFSIYLQNNLKMGNNTAHRCYVYLISLTIHLLTLVMRQMLVGFQSLRLIRL